MNTDRLFEFHTLAQVLHYGQAAKTLYLAQSILSRHIQSLEQELGVKLFQRNSHTVTLTAAGRALHRASWDYLQTNAMISERIRTAAASVAGSIRFACLRSVLHGAIKDFLSYFCETYPDVLLCADVLSDTDSCDISSYHCLVVPSSALKIPECFHLQATFWEESWLVFPNGHPLQSGGEISLAKLSGETLFIPGYHGSIGSFARIRQIAEQVTAGKVQIVRVPTPESALLNAHLGRGFTILPRHLLDEQTRNIHHAAIREDCRFEILFYTNESLYTPAIQQFSNEFCRLMVSLNE